MIIKFDSNQQYQLDAIGSIVDLFDSQPLAQGQFEMVSSMAGLGMRTSETGTANFLQLDESTILKNLQTIQKRNDIPESDKLDGMNFSVEMETGTGKTYVYLRSIFELNKQYGFKKFIIVVPSVAIREGVQKSIELTRDHFKGLYGNEPLDCWVYDSKQVSRLRQFATSNQLQVLIINIDAFNKKTNNVIHIENDRLSGRKPIEFIQQTNPIVILDEPQNMESDKAKEALASLNPLCTLRYSATHRNLYNPVYRLDPVTAYDLNLVKRIEVDSVLEEADFNKPYIQVKSIKATKTKITAKVEIDIESKSGPKRKSVSVSNAGVDLFELSNKRPTYEGYVIEEINYGEKYISFSNGIVLREGETHGGQTDDIMRVQIRETIRGHFEKELALKQSPMDGQSMKVLSLFFIDRVANYYLQDGKIRKWFVEAYREIAADPKYKPLNPLPVEEVHNGYFSCQKGQPKDTSGKTIADDEAYALIMKDKERLLSLEEPLKYIFSHSALREGWDNPNVFQICTLNETKSEIKKRQEIGRGMRLPIMENGERCFDKNVNKLTVIANESYEDFARKLQTEIEDECGVVFDGGRIKHKKKRRKIKLKKGWNLNEDFKELWERIKYRTRYSVDFESSQIIEKASESLKDMPRIEHARLEISRAEIKIDKSEVKADIESISQAKTKAGDYPIPDLLGYLQRETELTRKTLSEILIKSNRLNDVPINPQRFLDQAGKCIKATLNRIIVDGIKYDRIAGAEYEMMLFKGQEILAYLNSIAKVDNSIYDAIECDSKIEKRFAEELDKRTDIKLFIKLPGWFKVDTPVGKYNPDWAIVKQPEGEAAKLYLVRETKGAKAEMSLRGAEWAKIKCGKAHFDSLKTDVDFAHVTSAAEI